MKKIIRKKSRKKLPKAEMLAMISTQMSRRDFLLSGSALTFLSGLSGCQNEHKLATSNKDNADNQFVFNKNQHSILNQVQLILFPDDGNGPSAVDIHALDYLETAMNDQGNQSDGDPEFINNGVKWLDELANTDFKNSFLQLNHRHQQQLIEKISHSRQGNNWLALLIYYLTEALMLDPIYGGNTDQMGWKWLQHQPGFPRPVAGKTWRDFDRDEQS